MAVIVTGDVLFSGNDIGYQAEGRLEMTTGLDNAVYLSLFGGNQQDSGNEADTRKQWWGNFTETVENRFYRSEFQNTLVRVAATTSNLVVLEDAADRDLAWLIPAGAASSITNTVSLTGINRIRLVVEVEAVGRREDFTFFKNWELAV